MKKIISLKALLGISAIVLITGCSAQASTYSSSSTFIDQNGVVYSSQPQYNVITPYPYGYVNSGGTYIIINNNRPKPPHHLNWNKPQKPPYFHSPNRPNQNKPSAHPPKPQKPNHNNRPNYR